MAADSGRAPPGGPDFRVMSEAERLALARAMNPKWAEEELPAWAESKAQVDPDVARHIQPLRETGWEQVLARVECPALLLTGDPELGAIVTPAVAREAMALLERGQLIRISGAGHNIRREGFEKTMEVVRGFLARVADAATGNE
jgi:pimeloyl-ACP methyl ester carboxylesterase